MAYVINSTDSSIKLIGPYNPSKLPELVLTVDVDGNMLITGDVVVNGDVNIKGSTTVVDTNSLSVKDELVISNFGIQNTLAAPMLTTPKGYLVDRGAYSIVRVPDPNDPATNIEVLERVKKIGGEWIVQNDGTGIPIWRNDPNFSHHGSVFTDLANTASYPALSPADIPGDNYFGNFTWDETNLLWTLGTSHERFSPDGTAISDLVTPNTHLAGVATPLWTNPYYAVNVDFLDTAMSDLTLTTEPGTGAYQEIIRLSAPGSTTYTDDIILAVGAVDALYGLTIAESGNTITFAHANTSSMSVSPTTGLGVWVQDTVDQTNTFINHLTVEYDTYGHIRNLISDVDTVNWNVAGNQAWTTVEVNNKGTVSSAFADNNQDTLRFTVAAGPISLALADNNENITISHDFVSPSFIPTTSILQPGSTVVFHSYGFDSFNHNTSHSQLTSTLPVYTSSDGYILYSDVATPVYTRTFSHKLVTPTVTTGAQTLTPGEVFKAVETITYDTAGHVTAIDAWNHTMPVYQGDGTTVTSSVTSTNPHTTTFSVVLGGVLNDSANFAFKTIAVAGQTSVVADSSTDTLTLVKDTYLDILTNATTDTITFDVLADTASTANTLVARDGISDIYVNVMHGTATSALYADVAERYEADAEYEPGTVMVFGGEKEITQSVDKHDHRVAGVLSTNPALRMNESAGDDSTHPFLALTGRVPVKVVGKVRKGDLLITSYTPGHAKADNMAMAGRIIGKAITEHIEEGYGVVEALINLM